MKPSCDLNSPASTHLIMKIPALGDFRRIVIKVGSSLLVDAQAGRLKEEWLSSLAADIAEIHRGNREVLVVSSGAIVLGRAVLKLASGLLKLEDSQAAAAVGQIALARQWTEALSRHGIIAGQILLTLGDTEERRRYLNARSTIDTLLAWRGVPIINENDSVATSEIRYGDNDRLAARVATMVSADLLVLLSDVDGLYDAPPGNPAARHIPYVAHVTHEIEAMAGAAPSELSRGGMQTKIEAAKIATHAGTHMVIASGQRDHPLRAIAEGGRCTWFVTYRKSGYSTQEMDCRHARTQGHAGDRRRRGCGVTRRKEFAAGWCAERRRRLCTRRRCDNSRPRRPGDCSRSLRL